MKNAMKIIVAIIITTVLLASCQPTPKNAIVVSSENSDEVANSNENSSNSTDEWIEEITTDNGMQIIANATIATPQDSYYVLKASPTAFSDEQIKNIATVLAQGHNMYFIPPNSDTLLKSKEEVEIDIIQLKQKLQRNKSDAPENAAAIAEIEASIQRMEQLYQNSPTKTQLLDEQKKITPEQFKIPEGAETAGAVIDIPNDKPLAWLIQMSMKTDLKTNKISFENFQSGQGFLTQVGKFDDISEVNGLNITEDDAIMQASELINEMGIKEFDLDSATLAYTTSEILTSEDSEKKYYYSIYFTRDIEGQRVAQVNEKAINNNGGVDGGEADFRAMWTPERINVVLDDTGLRYFEYINPIITQAMEASEKILNTDEMKNRVTEQLRLSFGDELNKNTKLYITSVEVAYQFAPIKNDMVNYCIKPCYIVWGYLEQFEKTYAPVNHALIVIDAVDGSIIG